VESLFACDDLATRFLESDEPAASGAERSIPAGRQIGPYLVLEFLAKGGMGEVYKAYDTRLERTVAIKFLPQVLAANRVALERFGREARAASALNHPRICTA
jgi:eukaryotic-like serine/threonine-protein kinase